MFFSTVCIIIVILAVVWLSIRERMKLSFFRERSWETLSEGRSSPFSNAVLNLVGFAGGIYLSLVMLLDFMKFQIPDRVQIGHMEIEPLAGLSITLAVIQPFLINIFKRNK
ncbi:MAG: hypothetical protein WC364_01975 [Eubacteriales bacterium]